MSSLSTSKQILFSGSTTRVKITLKIERTLACNKEAETPSQHCGGLAMTVEQLLSLPVTQRVKLIDPEVPSGIEPFNSMVLTVPRLPERSHRPKTFRGTGSMKKGLLHCWNNSRASHSSTSECLKTMKCVPPHTLLCPPLLPSFHWLALFFVPQPLPNKGRETRPAGRLRTGAVWAFPLPKPSSRPLTLPHPRELDAVFPWSTFPCLTQ